MKLPRFGATVLAMGLALPLLAQAQAPSGTQRGSATSQPPPAAQRGNAPSPSATPAARPTAPAPSPSTAQGKLIDINTASESELDALPGIGKARADAIIKNRPYRGKDDLLARHVIPQNVYNGIKDKVIARQG